MYLSYGVASSKSLIPFVIMKEEGGIAISWNSTRVESNYGLNVNTPFDQFYYISEQFESFKKGNETADDYEQAYTSAKNFLKRFRDEEEIRPGYFTNTKSGFDMDSIKSVLSGPSQVARFVYKNRVRNSYITENPFQESASEIIFQKGLSAYRKFRMSSGDIFDEPRLNESFILFPLHLQPEATTSLLAPMYLDQPSLVRQVARSLPIDCKLYVKEHPSMVGQRALSYYKRFSDISSVRLISPWTDSHKLIQESKLVTTITGTAGLEALFYKTPVLAFGEPSYSKMEMVARGGDPELISEQIFTALDDWKHDERELIQYLTALFQHSFQFPVNDNKESVENAEVIYEQISPFIR